jgi:hypothetical protein
LYDTKFGRFLQKNLNINIDRFNPVNTKRLVPHVTLDDSGKYAIKKVNVFAYKVKGKPFAKLVGRALLRIPVISVLALSLLELPEIISKSSKGKNFEDKIKEGSYQTIKSIINVSSILAGIGMIGALLAKKGPVYSLIGMGIGSIAGAYTSKNLQQGFESIVK